MLMSQISLIWICSKSFFASICSMASTSALSVLLAPMVSGLFVSSFMGYLLSWHRFFRLF